ncbi:MAG: thermonuclease family protein [Rubrivivax sp.]|jgi:endonuclease YncB( thermonuclease family)|nr:thermonuclease family protein [Rubrivivax sp.]
MVLGVALVPAVVQAQGKSRAAAVVEGRVDKVVDGDSLWFVATASGQRTEVRLLDIDAPEICQDGGEASRLALQDLVAGKTALLSPGARDRHGRTLARLKVDGQDVSRRQVIEGQAWSTRVRWDRGPLVAEERTAAALKRGLHAAGGAEQPHLFRARNGPCVAPAPR